MVEGLLSFLWRAIPAVFLTKLFSWPLSHYVIVDDLYETIGFSFINLAIDFTVFFLLVSFAWALADLMMMLIIFKSLFRGGWGRNTATNP